MSPHRSPRRRPACLIVSPLALLAGFATGAWLAHPTAPLEPSAGLERPAAYSATAGTAHGAQTRRSVQTRIDSVDPAVWLASYGSVSETDTSEVFEAPSPLD